MDKSEVQLKADREQALYPVGLKTNIYFSEAVSYIIPLDNYKSVDYYMELY